ncbi:uncharacterized protein METZ01_LOCUS401273, partial [marine metagenome]
MDITLRKRSKRNSCSMVGATGFEP